MRGVVTPASNVGSSSPFSRYKYPERVANTGRVTMEDLNDGQKDMLQRYLVGRDTDRTGELSKAWFGRVSSFNAKERVKQLCKGPNDESKFLAWDPVNKWWGTRNLAFVPALIDCNLWTPIGLSEDLTSALHKEATRYRSLTVDLAVKQDKDEAIPLHTSDCASKVSTPKPIVFEILRKCPLCKGTPIAQFLECSCCDLDTASWVFCEQCRCIHNPHKLQRLDDGAFNEIVAEVEKPVVRAGLKCLCRTRAMSRLWR